MFYSFMVINMLNNVTCSLVNKLLKTILFYPNNTNIKVLIPNIIDIEFSILLNKFKL